MVTGVVGGGVVVVTGCGAVVAGATVVTGAGVGAVAAVVVGTLVGALVGDDDGADVLIGAGVVPVATSSSSLHAVTVSAAQAATQNPRVNRVVMTL